jgi:hypothetical protein
MPHPVNPAHAQAPTTLPFIAEGERPAPDVPTAPRGTGDAEPVLDIKPPTGWRPTPAATRALAQLLFTLARRTSQRAVTLDDRP